MKPIRLPQSFRNTFNRPKPFLSLCVIFRNNESTIRPLLESVFDHFDEFVFTDTGCTDTTRKVLESFVEGLADGKTGRVTDFRWCDDFAKARQANFEAATGKWRVFLDTDDVLVHGENLRALLEKTEKNHPQVEGLFVPYDYDVLEELPTMRVVKWGPGWEWTDAIHERLVLRGRNAPSNILANIDNLDTLHVRHKRKNAEEKDSALRRNAAIARREYASTKDLEYKARLARTIAMELKLDGKFDEAKPYLLEVATNYAHLPEGKQAYADLSRFAAKDGDLDAALAFARNAGPSYECIVYHAKEAWAKCIEAGTRASVAGQQTTHEGFLFEQVFAPMCLADAAAHLNYPPEGIENVINAVRGDLRTHEAVRDATASLRKHIDRITIVVPNTPQPFDETSTGAMLGGSEEAVVYLSRALARQGRNVRVYGVLPPLSIPHVDRNGVDWRRFEDFNVDDEHGTLVVWRATGLVKHLLETQISRIKAREAGNDAVFPPAGIGNSSLWLHDMHTGVGDAKLNNSILKGVSSVVVLSDHHQKCIERHLPAEHNVKFVKLANGVVAEQLAKYASAAKDPNKVVYTSCPSRGLRSLLKAWPKIKEECPDAYLDIYYDWSMLQRFQPEVYAGVAKAYEAVRHLDVKHHGGVGHADLYEAMSTANVWAYSHYENTDVETFCISAVKASMLGCHVITAPNGALPEVVPDATFVPDAADYARTVIEAIKNPISAEQRLKQFKAGAERFDWGVVAQRFGEVWTVLPK